MTTFYRHKQDKDSPFFFDGSLATDNGRIRLVPQGGGFGITMTKEVFDRDFRPATPEEMRAFDDERYDYVQWDGGDKNYRCLLNERRWNGWLMPAFPRDSATALIRDLVAEDPNETNQVLRIQRDGKRLTFAEAGNELQSGDAVVMWWPDGGVLEDEAEVIEPIMIKGEETWGIGAGSWCWQQGEAPGKEASQDADEDDTPSP